MSIVTIKRKRINMESVGKLLNGVDNLVSEEADDGNQYLLCICLH